LAHVAAFLIMLGVLIFIHELGHFIAARLAGVKVLKFSIGFPPTLFKRKWGEMECALGLIPLGGYVKVLGRLPESLNRIRGLEQSRSLAGKSALVQAGFFASGPIANYVFAFILICSAYVFGPPGSAPVVGTVLDNSPALAAGFQSGDRITAINDRHVERWNELVTIIRANPGNKLKISLDRDGNQIDLHVTPVVTRQNSSFAQPIAQIGIKASNSSVHKLGLIYALKEGCNTTANLTWGILSSVAGLFTGNLKSNDIGGPLSIYHQSNQYYEAGVFGFLFYMSFISINLAFFNLLPIPILDGGSLLFLFIQTLLGRPITMKMRRLATLAGFVFIITVTLLIFHSDVMRMAISRGAYSP
jgi:regulator of sigma E protease